MPLPQWTTLSPQNNRVISGTIKPSAPTCEAVLAACSKAVEAQKQAIADQQAVIDQLKKTSVDDREALAKAQDKGFLSNPAVLILIGALGAVILTEKVLK